MPPESIIKQLQLENQDLRDEIANLKEAHAGEIEEKDEYISELNERLNDIKNLAN